MVAVMGVCIGANLLVVVVVLVAVVGVAADDPGWLLLFVCGCPGWLSV